MHIQCTSTHTKLESLYACSVRWEKPNELLRIDVVIDYRMCDSSNHLFAIPIGRVTNATMPIVTD